MAEARPFSFTVTDLDFSEMLGVVQKYASNAVRYLRIRLCYTNRDLENLQDMRKFSEHCTLADPYIRPPPRLCFWRQEQRREFGKSVFHPLIIQDASPAGAPGTLEWYRKLCTHLRASADGVEDIEDTPLAADLHAYYWKPVAEAQQARNR